MSQQSLGSIYTPLDYAETLTRWAIQAPTDKVLDLGVGAGVFVFSSYKRLLEIGALPEDAQSQIVGSEIDFSAYSAFVHAAKRRGLEFSNLFNSDFFEIDVPEVDAVVGNPPYVRRSNLDGVDKIRDSVLSGNEFLQETDLSRLTDLYVYFLIHSIRFLKPGGRLAVITADPWLNVSYGQALKNYLLQVTDIDRLISLDRRVFDDAQVKPVLLFARKRSSRSVWKTDFIRVKNGLPVAILEQHLEDSDTLPPDITLFSVEQSSLRPEHPWSVYFKMPSIYEELALHHLMSPIRDLANTRIGLQTLAKDFFVLSAEQVESLQIEEEFLRPLAQSLQYCDEPIIESGSPSSFFLFYCSEEKEQLHGTNALRHIASGETKLVKVRGKDITVVGYHNKKRIQKSGRTPWYNLKTSLERRGHAKILIPRLVYKNFAVIWNRAGYVPGELFIEFAPKEDIPPEVYLCILNSTVAEIMFRAHAQVYGGGTYNMKPGAITNVSVINASLLTQQQQQALISAYQQYIADPSRDRAVIDESVFDILEFDASMRQRLVNVLEDLLIIATSSKRRSVEAT